jgi:hypothetical protein
MNREQRGAQLPLPFPFPDGAVSEIANWGGRCRQFPGQMLSTTPSGCDGRWRFSGEPAGGLRRSSLEEDLGTNIGPNRR